MSARIADDPEQGIYVTPISDSTGANGAWVRQYNGPLDAGWWGALGDWDGLTQTGTDDTVALQATLNWMALTGESLRLFRNHLITEKLLVTETFGDFHLFGGGTIINNCLDGGIDISLGPIPSPTNRIRYQVNIQDIGIYCIATGDNGTALKVSYNVLEAVIPTGRVQNIFQNLKFTPDSDLAAANSSYWKVGLHCHAIAHPKIFKVYVTGRAGSAHLPGSVGIWFTGDLPINGCTAPMLFGCSVLTMEIGYLVGGDTEGGHLVQCHAVACTEGIVFDSPAVSTGGSVISCHPNAYKNGIRFTKRHNAMVVGCLFIHRTDAYAPQTTDYRDILIDADSHDVGVSECSMGSASTERTWLQYGIDVQGGGRHDIHDNRIEYREIGIHVADGVSNTIVKDNPITNCDLRIWDESTAETNSVQAAVTGKDALYSSSVALAIPDITDTIVLFNTTGRNSSVSSRESSTGVIRIGDHINSFRVTAAASFAINATGGREISVRRIDGTSTFTTTLPETHIDRRPSDATRTTSCHVTTGVIKNVKTAKVVSGMIDSPTTPGLIRLTAVGHGLTTGDWINLWGVRHSHASGGDIAGEYIVTVIGVDTLDLQGSVYLAGYISGGWLRRMMRLAVAVYQSSGGALNIGPTQTFINIEAAS